MDHQLTVLPDAAALADAAAERITRLVETAIAGRGVAAIALSGGRTPEPIYQRLADAARPWRARIDWTRVHLYWSDERNVPPDHPDSNFGMANRALITHVPIPVAQVYRMRGELPAGEAGSEYDARLRARRLDAAGPLFDVMLLGLGPDAHIASIFPESPILSRGPQRSAPHVDRESSDAASPESSDAASPESSGADLSGPRTLAAGVWVPKMNQWRITLTPPALLDSAAIVVLAAGSEKADALAAAVNGELDITRHPAQLLRAAGDRLEWLVDTDAAKLALGG